MVIGLFIFLAASGEAAQAQLRAVAQGTLVSDAMIINFDPLGSAATVNDAADALIRTTQTEFPIVDSGGRLRGVLTRDAMIKALKERGPDTPVLEGMQTNIPTVRARSNRPSLPDGEAPRRRRDRRRGPQRGTSDPRESWRDDDAMCAARGAARPFEQWPLGQRARLALPGGPLRPFHTRYISRP